ncbi:iron-containing alcohol dehydrogenase (plasmid) [Paenibacillus rhizovicinus]|uniref:Iron-containing alcohol dehydrogenase n=1 Tax=Paenibacillus rhizovicinus TaxID=2704463 RepID=A0A6C0PB55_9BACL|nr:iron-containing alcohol dehydrogenase [Paenibacillus rhizovicinus]QHW35748.1 iron-containing alcohol dehydrogenase [Paenibacillus rhizovicinus]
MNKEELIIGQLLSQAEQLVYRFLKEESLHGTIKLSMKEMAKQILHRYNDEIQGRPNPTTGETEKTLSEATVHRAIRKMTKEGIVGVLASQEKSESNEIIFYGLPDEERQVDELMDLGQKLSLSLSRFQSLLARKDQELEQVKRERQGLFKEIDAVKAANAQLTNTNTMLNQMLQEYLAGHEVFGQGKIIEAEKLPDGTIAVILQQ